MTPLEKECWWNAAVRTVGLGNRCAVMLRDCAACKECGQDCGKCKLPVACREFKEMVHYGDFEREATEAFCLEKYFGVR